MKFCITALCALLIAFGSVGCGRLGARSTTDRSPRTEAQFLQELHQTPEWKQHAALFDKHKASAAAIMTHATRVQSFRLVTHDGEKALGRISGVPFYAVGPEQGSPFAARLAAIVLDPKTYPYPGQSTKLCEIEPGVGFRVWSGPRFVDVVLCFSCNQLAVLENDPHVPLQEFDGRDLMQGHCYVAGDFDAVRPQLVALSKEALPGDRIIQSL